jgi:ABC-type transport system involved in cytochrome c biogenesis permease subunit
MATLLSVATLAVFGWTVAFLIPKARREHELFALTCSVLAALVALVCFWLFADGVR